MTTGTFSRSGVPKFWHVCQIQARGAPHRSINLSAGKQCQRSPVEKSLAQGCAGACALDPALDPSKQGQARAVPSPWGLCQCAGAGRELWWGPGPNHSMWRSGRGWYQIPRPSSSMLGRERVVSWPRAQSSP